MRDPHDIVLIGAGPAAVAALAALPNGMRVAVLTGEDAGKKELSGRIHPKIRAVSLQRGEAPGMTSPLPFAEPCTSTLFDSASVGGLANYWGQQFVRDGAGDPWAREIFADHQEYERACAEIESLFVCSPPGTSASGTASQEDYSSFTPRLVLGVPDNPSCGLLAMREALDSLCEQRGLTRYSARARGWEKAGAHMRVHLENGRWVDGRGVLLAAGVVGSLRLTMASCPEIRGASLKDHAPHLLHVAGLKRQIALLRSDGVRHFNSLTIEWKAQARTRLFASVYRMSHASLGLLLAALGLPPLLPRLSPPGLVDWITPVQVWTEKTTMHYDMARGNAYAKCVDRPNPDTDDRLQHFQTWLRGKGATVLKRSVTPAGDGFHYHAAQVSLQNGSDLPLQDFLETRFAGQVQCVDASRLQAIGYRPPL